MSRAAVGLAGRRPRLFLIIGWARACVGGGDKGGGERTDTGPGENQESRYPKERGRHEGIQHHQKGGK